jgi:hypothetical protein
LIASLAAALLLPAATATAATGGDSAKHARTSAHAHRQVTARRAGHSKVAALEPLALAATLAERYWGAAPCSGQISLRADQPLPAGLEASTDAWVTFESSLGANNLQAPAGTYSNCAISLASWQWPTRMEMVGDWNMLCLTVVHEMGHLLGKAHSLVPGSVMAPVFEDESSVPSICKSARARVQAGAGLSPIG